MVCLKKSQQMKKTDLKMGNNYIEVLGGEQKAINTSFSTCPLSVENRYSGLIDKIIS